MGGTRSVCRWCDSRSNACTLCVLRSDTLRRRGMGACDAHKKVMPPVENSSDNHATHHQLLGHARQPSLIHAATTNCWHTADERVTDTTLALTEDTGQKHLKAVCA